MALEEIKRISIRNYLEQKGISPQKENAQAGMYYSPFREDKNPSFKVDYEKNLWYDFGANEGGSIIDLVMKMENISFHQAATKLENICLNTQLLQQPNVPTHSHTNVATSQHTNSNSFSFRRYKIIPVTHPKLIDWIKERKIDLALANQYCREIHYQNRDKDYFAIGFKNDKGGYELSCPPNFKGCISPKEITTFSNGGNTCLVFEGFWDFLSYLTLRKIEKTSNDAVILNSVANIHKAMDFLKLHKEIYTYLDNDEAGRKATELIKSTNSTVHNRSTQYKEYKDLNDYLCGKKLLPVKQVRKGFKL